MDDIRDGEFNSDLAEQVKSVLDRAVFIADILCKDGRLQVKQAIGTKVQFDAYLAAGFTSEQAMQLICHLPPIKLSE